jgi:hypothetical protein
LATKAGTGHRKLKTVEKAYLLKGTKTVDTPTRPMMYRKIQPSWTLVILGFPGK